MVQPSTRATGWEADGERWSWVGYQAQVRAAYASLDTIRRRLERAMGIERLT